MKKENNSKLSVDKDIRGVLITIGVVFLFITVFYFISLYLNNSDSIDYSSTEGEAYIQYDEILAGSSFTINEGEYIVVYYDKMNEEYASNLYSTIANYQLLDDSLRIYSVDMSDDINKNYLADESTLDVDNVNDLKINDATLIKFNNGEIVESVTSSDSIVEYLNK